MRRTWRMKMKLNDDCSLNLYDAIQCLRQMPAESIDLIVTEPTFQSVNHTDQKYIEIKTSEEAHTIYPYELVDFLPDSELNNLFHQLYRVLKEDRHFYLICPKHKSAFLEKLALRFGFSFYKSITIETTYEDSRATDSDNVAMLFEKGNRKFFEVFERDTIRCFSSNDFYATERDSVIFEILIKQSSDQDELVCDPFMGGGSSGEAALELGRKYMGCDISHTAFERSLKRLSYLFESYEPLY